MAGREQKWPLDGEVGWELGGNNFILGLLLLPAVSFSLFFFGIYLFFFN